jgi:hypothetical protein
MNTFKKLAGVVAGLLSIHLLIWGLALLASI